MSSAEDLVALAVSQGGLGNDALLAAVLPLLHATAAVHERGLVAPLRGLDRLTVDEQTRLGFAPEAAGRPVLNQPELDAREGLRATAVEVVAHRQSDMDLGESGGRPRTTVVEPIPEAITAPVYLAGWQSWEHVVGHHDPLTDIFSLGQLLIGLGCGLDLSRTEDVARLIDARGNLYALDPGLHPVIVSVAAQMAEPDRHRRAQDLRSLIEQLENYREQPLDFDVEAITRGAADRRTAVLRALRDRLFDLSRRNRLVNFRPTAQTLNLTEVSVPLMLDVRTIRPEQLFTWRDELCSLLLGKAQPLGKWIRYDEAPYASNALDKLIATARRDRAEYGRDQLRLVPAFLRWHDLKNDPQTRLASPLMLAKVELTKKRGVRDSYTLRITDPVAEINPTLRHHLHQLYGINLPEKVDLAEPGAIATLHERLAKEIQATEPGLRLHLREKPRIDLVRQRAMLKLRNYRRRQHGNTAHEFGGRQYAYSYRRSDYQPLGVQIFRSQLAVQDLPLSIALGGEPRRPAVIETDTYTLDTEGGPYSWDVDLCAVSLANFNYRTLGLVRDYDELLETGQSCPSFDQLFSDRPRPISSEPPELPIAERQLVVPADGSQVSAIARAQRGESFVIQGPPGTGKSQTITNMIADFVARGQRVLFVCQKRAALDVVHARLASRRLDGLCTLIHDSQADKKSFVHGLRDTYESWLTASDDLDELTVRRDELVTRVERLLATVEEFEAKLATGQPRLREVVNRLAELRDHRWGDDLSQDERRLLPSPADWWSARPVVRKLAQELAAADPATGGVLARSPLAFVVPEMWGDAAVPSHARELESRWTAVATALAESGAPEPQPATPSPTRPHAPESQSVARSPIGPDAPGPDPVAASLTRPDGPEPGASSSAGPDAPEAQPVASPPAGADVPGPQPVAASLAGPGALEAAATSPAGADAPGAEPVAASHIGGDAPESRNGWTVKQARSLGELGRVLSPLAAHEAVDAINPTSAAGHRLTAAAAERERLVAAERTAWAAAAGWSEPLGPPDAKAALKVAQSKEGGLLSFLSGDWRRVKSLVKDRFDSTTRVMRPSVVEILTDLVAAHDATAAIEEHTEQTQLGWGTDDPRQLAARLAAIRKDPTLGDWRIALQDGVPAKLARIADALEHAEAATKGLLAAQYGGSIKAHALQQTESSTSSPLAPHYGDSTVAHPLHQAESQKSGLLAPHYGGSAVGDAVRQKESSTSDLLAPQYEHLTVGGVLELAERLASADSVVRAAGPALRELADAPESVQTVLRRLAATPEQLEYAICAAEWERSRSAAPLQVSSMRLDSIVGELSLVYDELTTLNADVVVAGVRRRFLTELAHSELSVSGMSPEDRARKKTFAAGRRELEHEFGKVMRYRSIRDLASGAPGAVVSLLRPVWLMSPSSVSDTLPLTTNFDVVVYDEASQIPVEEAIPALHRAPQVIVVGDQMQLPPTQYFHVRTDPSAITDPIPGTELGDELEDDGVEEVGITLTEDSFLSISARRLASTMLTWHYRSRSEALISFSNAAFYQGRLATVPDRLPANPAPPWTLRSDSPALAEVCDSLLAGSITAVQLVDGVYVRRTNPAEAQLIAGLVRELLNRRTGKSLGIVAFSEAQQGEIERALDELAEMDPEFGALYEGEQVRTHGEQDVGLFVKNLENVQGDERDIVLMSVCYAAGPDGRMLMNFGPINTSGGEKRLNVIFSRARQHMVVVSSIEPDAITNTYNDGANTLRRFLTYAAAVSRGDAPAAKAALAPYALGRRRGPVTSGSSSGSGHGGLGNRLAEDGTTAVVEQVRAALEAHGVEVDTAVGESVFRCDLALKLPGDAGHRLAVLIDTPERLAADSLLERLTTHPRALTDTGWRVHHILTTEWTRTPNTVITHLLETLHRPTDA